MTRLFDVQKIHSAFKYDDIVTVDMTTVKEKDRDVHRVQAFGPNGIKLYEVQLDVYAKRYELSYIVLDDEGEPSYSVPIDEGKSLKALKNFVSNRLGL